MQTNNPNIKDNYSDKSKRKLLSMSVVKKNSKGNTEKDLFNYLYPKFGKRFIDYRDKYENYLKDEKHKYLPDFPISVILELVNRCDLECTMCYQGFRNDAEKSTLEIKDLRKLFLEFKTSKLDALLLSASEPLLYKHFDEILKMAEESQIMDQFLFTNGNLLNSKNSQLILNSSLTRLFVSLDAATDETYDKVRIPVNKKILNTNRLKKVEDNVVNFINLRNSLGRKIPLVRVSFVALQKNVHEVDAFIEKWIDIVDSVEIQRENSIDFYDDLLRKKFDNKKLLLKKYNCNQPWGQVTIHSDGVVGPCCNTVGRNLPVGNILNQSLKDIWQGTKMHEIREGFLNNKPKQVCQLCLENEKLNL
tara:strand:+ start:76 stop:1161 length:1086 start_codon:yes stop_codon:yes gene_type:complete